MVFHIRPRKKAEKQTSFGTDDVPQSRSTGNESQIPNQDFYCLMQNNILYGRPPLSFGYRFDVPATFAGGTELINDAFYSLLERNMQNDRSALYNIDRRYTLKPVKLCGIQGFELVRQ